MGFTASGDVETFLHYYAKIACSEVLYQYKALLK